MMKGVMAGTVLNCLSIWQLLDEPKGYVVDTTIVNVHSNYLLDVSVYH